MPLGLKDLKKKSRPTASPSSDAGPTPMAKAPGKTVRTTSKPAGRPASFSAIYAGVHGKQKFPAGAWSSRGITARPWTDSGLTRNGRSRKSQIDNEASMNEDWINLFSTPWFWVECAPESRLIRLQQHLQRIEEQLQQKFREALDALEDVPGSLFGGTAAAKPIYEAIKRFPILGSFL